MFCRHCWRPKMVNIPQRADLTFKHNLKQGRHSWLRLTPAYSVKVVEQVLARNREAHYVLDPFSGTGTTGLVCAQQGIPCKLVDINPFLVWFAHVKTANYNLADLALVQERAQAVCRQVEMAGSKKQQWVPPIRDIDRWWGLDALNTLAQIYAELNRQLPTAGPAKDLLLVAFCHLLIRWSNAAFNHQSMSFKGDTNGQLSLFNHAEPAAIVDDFKAFVHKVRQTAAAPVPGQIAVQQGDARCLPPPAEDRYDCVITSPPYPNRMSYIRELRPYMYWLGYLDEAREAGELDWQAIGGTWGVATSRLQKWQPPDGTIHFPGFENLIEQIRERSFLLANYVLKYFIDIQLHLQSLHGVLAPGANVFYVVGNSKFYNTLVPTEQVYAWLLVENGFEQVRVETLRKRNSKKELFEFVVSAEKT
jgi:hypothetical protein